MQCEWCKRETGGDAYSDDQIVRAMDATLTKLGKMRYPLEVTAAEFAACSYAFELLKSELRNPK